MPQTHLFLHHVLKYHLGRGQLKEAVVLSTSYQNLVYFSHVLEILLHSVLESDSQTQDTEEDKTLGLTVEFVDHFESALDVIASCARKTELSRWKKLFDIAGSPRELFEVCSMVPLRCKPICKSSYSVVPIRWRSQDRWVISPGSSQSRTVSGC